MRKSGGSFWTQSFKGGLLALIFSILLALLLALSARFFNLPIEVLPVANQIAKGVSVVLAVALCVKDNNFLLKGIVVGAIFTILSLAMFALFNGEYKGLSILTDLGISVVLGGLVGFIKGRKN